VAPGQIGQGRVTDNINNIENNNTISVVLTLEPSHIHE